MSEKKHNEAPEESQLKIKYIFRDDYNPVYANGAYGGVTPSGEIVANFYFERHPLPKAEIIKIDSTKFEPEDLNNSAVRIIETGLIMSPGTAKVLAEWLLEQVETAKHLENISMGEGSE